MGLKSAAKHIPVKIFVEANDNFFPDNQSRRTQIPGWPKHHACKHTVLRTVLTQIHFGHLLAFGNKQTRLTLEQLQSFRATVPHFSGVDFLSHFHVTGRKKLLRAGARRSALAVVTPPNRFCHLSCFLLKTYVVQH